MLLCQDCCRNQIYHLFTLLNSLKSGTYGNFRLAISHISTDQAIHNFTALHIPFGSFNCQFLIFCLLKRKQLFKFFLPHRIWPIDITFDLLPCCIKFHQLFGNLFDRTLHTILCLRPFLSIQTINFRFLGFRPSILLNCLQLCGQYIEGTALIVFNFYIIFRCLLNLNLLNPPINAHTIAFMYHIIPHAQFCETLNFLSLINLAFFLALLLLAKNITLRNHDKL